VRYYFVLVGEWGNFVDDQLGVELTDFEAAREHATEVVRKHCRGADCHDQRWTLIVFDSGGRACLRLPVVEPARTPHDAFERHDRAAK
jgi:hypothetical protein